MSDEMQIPNRCRLILVIGPIENEMETQLAMLDEALKAGDVASVILSQGTLKASGEEKQTAANQQQYLDWCVKMVAVIQQNDVAAICVSDTQALGRSGADGVIAAFGKDDATDMLARFSPQKSVGLMNVRDRHRALEAGELNPDFIFFGAPEGDIKPEAHPKNIALGEWWAHMVEIPGVVMAGSDLKSVVEVAKTGVDFVAAGLAITTHVDGMAAAVREANRLLDEHAPEFEDAV